MPKSHRSKFLTTTEAAEYLRLVPHTLENMRSALESSAPASSKSNNQRSGCPPITGSKPLP